MRSRFLLPIGAALSLALSLLPVTPSQAQTAPRTGTIVGVVTDRDTRQPIGQATVSVIGSALGATSDDAGRFVIKNVAEGSHRLRAWRLDYPAVLISDVVVSPGRETEARITLVPEAVQQSEVEVTADAFAKPKDQATSSYQMSYEEIRRSPGAIGDVFRLVQSLPGVITTNDQRNDIVARGGSPSENLILVDGFEVPTINHFGAQGTTGGPISMLNNELVRDASFLAGGFPAQYGERLSSTMDIRLREGNRDRFQSETDITAAGAGQILEGPLGKKGSWLLTARTSYYDLIAESFGIAAVPYATNGQLKLNYDLTPRDQLTFMDVSGRDAIKLKPDNTDTEDPFNWDLGNFGWRTTNGASWQRLFGTWGWGTLALSDNAAYYETTIRDRVLNDALVYENHSTEGETALRYDLAGRSKRIGDWKAGLSSKRLRMDFALAQPLGTQNPFSTDTTRVDKVDLHLDETSWLHAGYAQWTHAVLPYIDATVGARVSHFGQIDATTLDPRAALSAHVAPGLDISLSYGRYHQAPAAVFVRADPSNTNLKPLQADHYVGNVSYIPRSDLKLTVEAYAKEYADYPVARDYREFSLANTGDVYGVFGLLFPMVSAGMGRARGIEFYAQKKLTDGLYGQLSYGYSRVEHAALDGIYRRGGFDAPHTGTVIVGYKKGAAWEFSTRFSYSTGRPTTPPLEPFSTQQNRYIYDLANLNGVRAADYHRLDLRADRRLRLGGRNVTAWFEAQNVYDRDNVFQYLWDTKSNELKSIPQIRFLPIVGFNIEL